MPNSPELRAAITLVMMHGQHECIYKDEVYEGLYEGISCPELKMFFRDMRELIIRAGFEASAYHLFFESAKDGDFDFCDELIKTVLTAYISDEIDKRAQVSKVDAAIEAELRTAFAFLELPWSSDKMGRSTGTSTSTEGERWMVSPVSAGDGSSEHSAVSDVPRR